MRYFKLIDAACQLDWGGDPTYWLEINEHGNAERQLEVYPNGNVVSYDCSHQQDEYGVLAIMVTNGDADRTWWREYEISKEYFEEAWSAHRPLNRTRDHTEQSRDVDAEV